MALVQPEKSRIIMEDLGPELRIIIPAERNFLVIFFLFTWLIGWAFGGLVVVRQLLGGFSGNPWSGSYWFLVLWFLGWVLGCVFAFYTIAWGLAGKEIITLTPERLKIEKKPVQILSPREFLLSEARNFRTTPGSYSFFSRRSFQGQGEFGIFFDYGAKSYGFAQGIAEKEAASILEKIKGKNFIRYSSVH